ncbi:hypothetical protein [Salisediminibacterium selenitireducens]|uniref:Uncharacterized protein n=1 Tax=Bacillus selenitireducens (strain ATCC 700615 / DSM 15326 / MLS10) TaxID=439292 RepID=D6XSV4_BACIE|nr:hypothetical protein [Salisediminibacterium selenitireducens]ADH98890.1 hypothetical protein Bsel_1378 [[Bacillus] selenitireducens MLS10]
MVWLIHQLTRSVPLWIFLLGVTVFFLFLLFVLPSEAARSTAYFGGVEAPDTQFFYTGDDLVRIASAFGAEGRAYYIRSRFTFDVVWPLAYGFFLWSGIAWLKGLIGNQLLRYLPLIPVTAVLLDFLENSGASLVMYVYPEQIPIITGLIPLFTTLKWLIIGVSFALLAGLLVMTPVIRRGERRRRIRTDKE